MEAEQTIQAEADAERAASDAAERERQQRLAEEEPGLAELEVGGLRVEARGPRLLVEEGGLDLQVHYHAADDDRAWRIAEALGEGGTAHYGGAGTTWIHWAGGDFGITLFASRDVVERYDPNTADRDEAVAKLAGKIRGSMDETIGVARPADDGDEQLATMRTYVGTNGRWSVAGLGGVEEYASLREVVEAGWRA